MLLFLAPTSTFDQTLPEDESVNRLWDSVLIWKNICISKLLKNVSFVLLLNKCDILDAKLKSGIRFAQHVTSYKSSRPNETEEILLCAAWFPSPDLEYTDAPTLQRPEREVPCSI